MVTHNDGSSAGDTKGLHYTEKSATQGFRPLFLHILLYLASPSLSKVSLIKQDMLCNKKKWHLKRKNSGKCKLTMRKDARKYNLSFSCFIVLLPLF